MADGEGQARGLNKKPRALVDVKLQAAIEHELVNEPTAPEGIVVLNPGAFALSRIRTRAKGHGRKLKDD